MSYNTQNDTAAALGSEFRTPADALAFLRRQRKSLRRRENYLNERDARGEATPAQEQALARVQAQLGTIEHLRVSLTDDAGDPLDVFPAACYPRHDAEARRRGQDLHLSMILIGFRDEAERRARVAEELGRPEGEDLRFRALTAEEVRAAKAGIPGLGVAEREDPREEAPPYWQPFVERCNTLGIDAETRACVTLGLSAVTPVDELSRQEVFSCMRKLDADEKEGHVGGRRPGTSLLRTGAHGRAHASA